MITSTTVGASFDADNENRELPRDKSNSEAESDQGNNPDPREQENDQVAEPNPREPKYKVGTFVKREVDSIACSGFIHGYALDNESFMYHVQLNKPDTDESITKEDILDLVFFVRLLGSGEELGCFGQGGQN